MVKEKKIPEDAVRLARHLFQIRRCDKIVHWPWPSLSLVSSWRHRLETVHPIPISTSTSEGKQSLKVETLRLETMPNHNHNDSNLDNNSNHDNSNNASLSLRGQPKTDFLPFQRWTTTTTTTSVLFKTTEFLRDLSLSLSLNRCRLRFLSVPRHDSSLWSAQGPEDRFQSPIIQQLIPLQAHMENRVNFKQNYKSNKVFFQFYIYVFSCS